MNISILDDYHDTLRTLECFNKLAGHEITIWNDYVRDTNRLAERLRDTDVLRLAYASGTPINVVNPDVLHSRQLRVKART